jgi:hypothetical protein
VPRCLRPTKALRSTAKDGSQGDVLKRLRDDGNATSAGMGQPRPAGKRKIFVVGGSAGDYDDKLEWNVAAFSSARAAAAFKGRCQVVADRLYEAWQAALGRTAESVDTPKIGRHRLDPFFAQTDGKANYWVQPLWLREEPPTES